MKFKGLPFHFVLRLKYKEKREGGEQKEIETTDRGVGLSIGAGYGLRREARKLETFTVNLNF